MIYRLMIKGTRQLGVAIGVAFVSRLLQHLPILSCLRDKNSSPKYVFHWDVTLKLNLQKPELPKLVLSHPDKAILKDASRKTCKPETPSRGSGDNDRVLWSIRTPCLSGFVTVSGDAKVYCQERTRSFSASFYRRAKFISVLGQNSR